MTNNASPYICAAQIGRAHGIKGNVHITAFVENTDLLLSEDGVLDKNGEFLFHIKRVAPHKKGYMVEIDGVTDRNRAEELRHTKLYIPRENLPDTAEEEEFYHIDLIGLETYLAENEDTIGHIVAVHNFGAGDLLEIEKKKSKETFFIPFTKQYVPTIDKEKKQAIICLPDNFFASESQNAP